MTLTLEQRLRIMDLRGLTLEQRLRIMDLLAEEGTSLTDFCTSVCWRREEDCPDETAEGWTCGMEILRWIGGASEY